MKAQTHYLWFNTKSRQEIIDVTDEVVEQVRASGVQEGLVLVSAMHITASVFVNDHESGLWADILQWLEQTIAPWEPGRYRHNETGEDNAKAARIHAAGLHHDLHTVRRRLVGHEAYHWCVFAGAVGRQVVARQVGQHETEPLTILVAGTDDDVGNPRLKRDGERRRLVGV